MGLRTGALHMQTVTQSVIEILGDKGYEALAYIDDMAGAESTENRADTAFKECKELLSELGLKEAPSKSTPPNTCMTWLGIVFNTTDMTMSIPVGKIQQIHTQAREWIGRSACTSKQLKKLLGKLFFAASCSSTLRLFTNRMLQTLSTNTTVQWDRYY